MRHNPVARAIDSTLESKALCVYVCMIKFPIVRHAGIRVKQIQGFAKGHDYRPGHQFSPGVDVPHAWNAVFLFGCWRLIDVTWGTGFTDHTGVFQRKLNEHFFLTDPEVFIWTHFPFDDLEAHYERCGFYLSSYAKNVFFQKFETTIFSLRRVHSDSYVVVFAVLNFEQVVTSSIRSGRQNGCRYSTWSLKCDGFWTDQKDTEFF